MEKLIFKKDSFFFEDDEKFVAKLEEMDEFDSLLLAESMSNDVSKVKEILINNYAFDLLFYSDDNEVGNAEINVYSDELVSICVISIKEEFRGRGYGLKAIELIKAFAKELGFKSVRGECRKELHHFYSKLGAKFESRLEEDNELMFDSFYYDLD
jgi:RimJ/RimL family protein N-acetyltransferase